MCQDKIESHILSLIFWYYIVSRSVKEKDSRKLLKRKRLKRLTTEGFHAILLDGSFRKNQSRVQKR